MFWDVLFRWSPEAVKEGMHVSVAESLTALVSKYLDCVLAAQQEEVEHFFSNLIGRARVREAISALQAARELSFVHVAGRVLLQVSSLELPAPHSVERKFKLQPRFAPQPPQPGKPLVQRRPRKSPSASPSEPAPSREGHRQGMSTARKLVIAIDGPAGSGKSTIAARLAKKLGYVNLESGAMYRALALKAMEQQVSLDDGEALRQLAASTAIELEPRGEGNRVLLDGRDVSQRDTRYGCHRRGVARLHPSAGARSDGGRQRELGQDGGVVMEGRDIGTAVFPNADLKIFLDAEESVRAERRVVQIGLALRRRHAAGDCGTGSTRSARPHAFGIAAGRRARRGTRRYHAQEY